MNEENYLIFGERLKQLLEEHNITQRQFSKEIDIDESAISRYINFGRLPHIEILIKIANYFNTTTDFLLGNDKTGEWIKGNRADYFCSQCGYKEFFATNYCGKCGAKMTVQFLIPEV